jgi:hypothetical protein
MRRSFAICAVAVLAAGAVPATAPASGTLFVRSAVENADHTVTLPLHRGTSHGRTVWYVVLDSSDGNDADARGVNRAQKLTNARGTAAVQRVALQGGQIDFPASVDFSPRRDVQAPNGFPPTVATPGAVGEPGYSPLVELPNGTILNAPQIARDADGNGRVDLGTEAADKVLAIDVARSTVRYLETDGFSHGNAVRYVSTDATAPDVAALEDVTFAPALNAAPFAGGDGTDSARASLAAFVNGQTGAANPERQGLDSALRDGLDPLNVLAWMPNQGRYSPLWDVHLSAWSPAAVAARANTRQERFADVEDLARAGTVTAPGGGRWGPTGVIVNCPIVSSR